MRICCLDLEGVLLPEFWIQVAAYFKNDALRLTTRDIPDYDKLMRYRLKILKKKGIRLCDIQRVLKKIEPLPGADRFLRDLRQCGPVIILSDTYYEFAQIPLARLGQPVLFCNWLKTDSKGFISDYILRQRNGKKKSVQALKKLGFYVAAAGDSYNDLAMLQEAHCGVLFNPPPKIKRDYAHFPVAHDYPALTRMLLKDNQPPVRKRVKILIRNADIKIRS